MEHIRRFLSACFLTLGAFGIILGVLSHKGAAIAKEEEVLSSLSKEVKTNDEIYSLQKTYPDVYGKIRFDSIPNINYIVVASDDPKTYLYQDLDKNPSKVGTPFLYPRKTEDDPQKVIYGHSFTSKKPYVFTKLYLTLEKDFYNHDPFFYIDTAHETRKYLIVGAFQIDTAKDRFYFHKTSFRNDDEKERWLKEVKKRTPYKILHDVDLSHEIVTLVTCTTDTVGGSKRVVVVGERIS